jgi:pyruvate, water dikinase
MKRFAVHMRALLRTLTGRSRHRRSFEQIFANFREVLDRNNRSLEIITSMGDTLGGDYLFDIQYVRRSYDELYAAMGGSLESFTRLTQNEYPQLGEVLAGIDERIRHGIEETFPESKDLVLPYERITSERLREVGGKNANLAELRNVVKVAVPEAFAITTGAFDAYMRHNRVFDKIALPADNGPVSEDMLRELYELVLHGAMPPGLSRAIEQAVQQLRPRCAGCSVAVRSSAGEEDGEFSFAGQFDTVLNVPLDAREIEKAYRKVIASLFSGKSSLYQARLGLLLKDMKMAVACVVMVDAEASGVLYTRDPGGDRNSMVISAAWGLGAAIVEGQADADLFSVSREGAHELVGTRIGSKSSMVVPAAGYGVVTIATPAGKQGRPSLLPEQVAELARLALRIEKHFRRPQDIEWAIDGQGHVVFLQTRPLRSIEDRSPAAAEHVDPARPVIAKDLGVAVQKGAAAGKVFVLKNEGDLDAIPRGAILVARHDSSLFVRVMTEVSAIITDAGAPTSHMAALCREFRIPTVVNAVKATELLVTGQEITVLVDGNGATLSPGLDHQLVERAMHDESTMEELFEFRKKRYLLRSIAPLNLIDPLRDEFAPQACRTMHDILRFIHEKSVAALIEYAEQGVRSGTVRLELPIPAGITVIDIGGGLDNPKHAGQVSAEQVASAPLRAIVSGMTHPGAWRSDVVPMQVKDFMSSMLRVPDLMSDSRGGVETNMAVVSGEYAHISLKFGYHFIVLDCFCSRNARNNHVYFRFTGGATDMSKRSRRLQLIALILEHYGFTMGTKGDLIVARLANMAQAEMLTVLDQLGRLISFTRQLDAVLNDDHAVAHYAQSFLDGSYAYAGSAQR